MSDGKYILDANGTPVLEPDLFAWGKWMQTADRCIAFTQVTPEIRVSTVFLGLDHSWNGPPEIYETMIFGGPHNEDQWRYSTREEAIAGHQSACELAVQP